METVNLQVAMQGLSRHTQRAYVRHIRNYLAAFHGVKPKQINIYDLSTSYANAALSPLTLRKYLGALKQRDLSRSTLTQVATAVLWLATLLVDLGRANPDLVGALKRIRIPAAETGQRGKLWLTAEEVRAILLAAPKVRGLTPAAIDRNLCIVTLIATTGLRREEVATALWCDLIQMGGHWVLTVHGKGEKIRHVKLPALALAALNRWQQRHPLPDGDLCIFSQLWKGGAVTTIGLSPKAIWEIVEAAARAAGIQHISPHVLRRTFARGAFEAGVSFELIRQALGHDNIATTERYVNAVLQLDRAATDVVAEGLEEE